jgi:hypothetical protein
LRLRAHGRSGEFATSELLFAKSSAPARPVGRHCGFLYRLDTGAPRLLHFAWHYTLRDDEPSSAYLWADIGLDELNAKFLAAFTSLLKRNEHSIPYGLDSGGSCFDSATGEFIRPPIGKGLTCSTFILAVLRSLGFALLLEESWPEREDDEEFGRQIVADLLENGADPGHVAAVGNDIRAKRFRPEEVVGGTISPSGRWPVLFEAAAALAEDILADLRAAA